MSDVQDGYMVASGDCLWTIAERLYGNGMMWRQLYALNRDSILNPNLIFPGQKLRLIQPQPDTTPPGLW